jgi:integrase
MRIGGLRALDVDDFDEARPAVEIRHRPETGTPLKRKENSERDVIITPETADIVRDYIETNRPDSTDDNGRKALIATEYGRASRTTITKHVYLSTSPCFHNGGTCPFNEDPQECQATSWGHASKCPGSVSPHALRRGYVTEALNSGQPKDVTADRVDMTREVMDKHYDKATKNEQMERREDYLVDI